MLTLLSVDGHRSCRKESWCKISSPKIKTSLKDIQTCFIDHYLVTRITWLVVTVRDGMNPRGKPSRRTKRWRESYQRWIKSGIHIHTLPHKPKETFLHRKQSLRDNEELFFLARFPPFLDVLRCIFVWLQSSDDNEQCAPLEIMPQWATT